MSDKLNLISSIIASRRTKGPTLFSDKTIDDAIIWKLLENANWAPNHKNTEPWRFRVYTQDALSNLSNSLQNCYKNHTPEEKFSSFKYEKIAKKVNASSHVLLISHQRNQAVPEWEEIAAIGAAVQNLWLSAEAGGIIGYWSSPKVMISHLKQYIDFSENESFLGLFYLGYPKTEIDLKKENGDIRQKVTWYSN